MDRHTLEPWPVSVSLIVRFPGLDRLMGDRAGIPWGYRGVYGDGFHDAERSRETLNL
jgi:hypothetical protein